MEANEFVNLDLRDPHLALGRTLTDSGSVVAAGSLKFLATKHMDADAGQIHQVLLNLVVNALDAMPKGAN